MNPKVNAIVKQIVDAYAPEKVFLFGSYAYGTETPDSDIDLLIIKRTNDRPKVRSSTVHKLILPYTIALDILVYTPDEFDAVKNTLNTIAYFVNKEGTLVYEKTVQ